MWDESYATQFVLNDLNKEEEIKKEEKTERKVIMQVTN